VAVEVGRVRDLVTIKVPIDSISVEVYVPELVIAVEVPKNVPAFVEVMAFPVALSIGEGNTCLSSDRRIRRLKVIPGSSFDHSLFRAICLSLASQLQLLS
jgi:hypothetical protein